MAPECLDVIVVKQIHCAIATLPAIAHQVNRDHLARLAQMACLAQLVIKVKMAKVQNQLHQCPNPIWALATNAHLDQPDLQDQLGLRAKEVEMDPQEEMAMMENQDLAVQTVNQDQLAHQEQMASPDQEDLQEIQALLEAKVQMDPLAMQDPQDHQDQQVAKETTVNQDQLDLLDHLDQQVIKAATEHLDQPAHLGLQDLQERMLNIARVRQEAQPAVEKVKRLSEALRLAIFESNESEFFNFPLQMFFCVVFQIRSLHLK